MSGIVGWIGASLILMGTLKTIFENEFKNRLHTIGISDVAGSYMLMLSIIFDGFEIPKVLMAMIFLGIWSPLTIHLLAKAYTSRLRR